jgi:hypothetical protein
MNYVLIVGAFTAMGEFAVAALRCGGGALWYINKYITVEI